MSRRRQRRPNPRDPLSQPPPDWRWRTLPVWIALTGGMVAGWYIGTAGSRTPFEYETWSFVVLIGLLFLFSMGLSRVVNRYAMIWVAKRRRRGQEKRILKDPSARR
jgi:hypothetical protein